MARSETKVAAVIAALLIAGTTLDRALADSTAPLLPAKSSRAETTGVLTGLVVGAAAAGPFGAIAGAAGGGWFGDRVHQKDQRAAALAHELNNRQVERQRMSAEIERLNSALTRLDTALANSLPLNDLAASVHFRTSDAALEVQDYEYLRKLGALLAQRTDRPVYVTGFADARGAPGFNFELSTARAETVADALVEGGLARTQLIVLGTGATLNGKCLVDAEHCAFERRATVQMTPADVDVGEDLLVQVTP
jgi:outer membrane protein OmpA-like peptidoglycan-associated protein